MPSIVSQLKMAQKRLAIAQREVKLAQVAIQLIRSECPHKDRERWTNNDGDGQFIVERCRVCGEQRDGGLR